MLNCVSRLKRDQHVPTTHCKNILGKLRVTRSNNTNIPNPHIWNNNEFCRVVYYLRKQKDEIQDPRSEAIYVIPSVKYKTCRGCSVGSLKRGQNIFKCAQ